MIDLIIKTNGSERRLKLPVDEQFVPGITEKNSVTTVMVVNEPESLRYLVVKQWNVDELNFLAKMIESFDNQEESQFNAAVSYLQPQSIKDLINLSFNLPRYSLISNVSNLAEVGRTHTMTRRQARDTVKSKAVTSKTAWKPITNLPNGTSMKTANS